MTRPILHRLALVALTGGLLAAYALRPAAPEGTGDDVAFFRAAAERVRAGEGHYPVWADESQRRRYPTASLFNWRLPTHSYILAALGDTTGALIAVWVLGVVAIGVGAAAVGRGYGLVPGTLFTLLALGTMAANGNPYGVYLTEGWAGLLILLSVSAAALRWPWVSVVAGLTALFLRELAGPSVLLALGYAVNRRAWREAIGWGVGLLLFAGFFVWHAAQVAAHRPADGLPSHGWLTFGGPAFAVTCARFNGWLMLAPGWLTPVYLAVGLWGFVAANRVRLAGLTAAGYFVGFLIAGRPVNDYWGMIPGPLLAMGVGLAVAVVFRPSPSASDVLGRNLAGARARTVSG